MIKHIPLTNEEKKNLKEGDEVYIQTSWGLFKGIYPEVLSLDTHVNLFGGETLEEKTIFASLFKAENI